MRHFVYSQRRNLPPITPRMMAVLIHLRAAQASDAPFDALHDVHKRTLTALCERDWIFDSPGRDGVRYRITARGLKALAIYEPALKFFDGLCPDCRERPKHVTDSGRVEGYCLPCLREQGQRKRALGIGKNPYAPCPRCHKRKRAVLPNGKVVTYCPKCTRTLKSKY